MTVHDVNDELVDRLQAILMPKQFRFVDFRDPKVPFEIRRKAYIEWYKAREIRMEDAVMIAKRKFGLLI
jgi:hypothetical protein